MIGMLGFSFECVNICCSLVCVVLLLVLVFSCSLVMG